MYRKSAGIPLIALAGVLTLASLSVAAPTLPSTPWTGGVVQAGEDIKVFHGQGTTNGGEFIVTRAADPSAGLFGTFCLERMEPIVLNTKYTITGISDRAYWGGVGPQGDPIDARTAYLYTKYYDGTLSNYNYHSSASADALQKAFWYLEQEVGGSNAGQSGTWIAEAESAIANGQWSGLGNVRVMNLNYFSLIQGQNLEVPVQDLLVMTGGNTPNNVVPEPGTLAIWGLIGGAFGLCYWRARRRPPA